MWRRCVSSEDDARTPGVRTDIACNDLSASAQCYAIVRRRGRTADDCIIRNGNFVCRWNIADGAAGGMAGSGLHIVVIDDDVTPVGHVDDVFARYRHLEGVVADGNVGSSRLAGATSAKCDTKTLNISDDITRDDELAHPRPVATRSRHKETALRIIRVIV